ncbi:PspC domain-containing protein [Rhodococcus sp. NPDC056743]|uniref:PspC domain-containing protein n=1 Tax=Rhodococcus sp. NPDC056743 TaxID=3345934 RepID=UPI00366C8D25
MTSPMKTRKLTRARSGAMFGGVCAGIARYFGWKASTVRLLFVLSCLLPGPQFLIYLVMWIFIPREEI